MEISLDNFFADIVVIMGYNKKNRAVFLNKNGKKKEKSVAIIPKKNSKSFLITNVYHKIIRKLQERQILCP